MQFHRSNKLNRRDANLSQSIVAVAILAMVQISCSQGSGAPPAPASSASKDAYAASSSSDAAAKDPSGLNGLLGGSGQTESDYDVRARQLKQLADQRASYENQMLQYQSYRTTLVQTQAGIEDTGVTSQAKGSLGGGIAGGAVGILGTLAANSLAGAAAPVTAATGATATTGATTGGSGLGTGLGSAFSGLGTGITSGIGADDYNKQLAAGTKVVAGSVQSQRDQYDAIIANLQAKIAAINAQIDALNAQKLKQ